jgi:hypothetical protein
MIEVDAAIKFVQETSKGELWVWDAVYIYDRSMT